MKKAIIIVLALIATLSLAVSFSACSTNKIDTPKNIAFDEDNNMTWDAVDNAKGYLVEATNVDTKEVVTLKPRKATCSLSDLPEGDYNIRIQSLPSSRKLKESNWTKDIYFKKLYETGCVYTLINNETEYEITRVGKATGTFTIEDEYRGKPVTSIATGAFKRSKSIVSVTVGNNVTSVGEGCFTNCSSLETVVLPDTLSEIGASCFLSCMSLKQVNVPKSLQTLPSYIFANCTSLEQIAFNDGLVEIEEYAFNNCSALKEIMIPDSVTSIGEAAFSDCKSLVKLVLGNGVKTIGDRSFRNCDLSDGIIFGEKSALKTIGEQAFQNASGLKGATLPEGVLYIGTNCFSSCPFFSYITIPDSCIYVGAYIIYKTELYPADAGEENKTEFYYADKWLVGVPQYLKKTMLKYVGIDGLSEEQEQYNFDIRDDTVGIASKTFYGCELLSEVSIPASVKYMSYGVFEYCSELTTFEAPYNGALETTGDLAFYKCSMLRSVSFPKNLKTIGYYCFYNCEKLNVSEDYAANIVPDSVTSIGADAFYGTALQTKAEGDVFYINGWAVGKSQNASSSISLKDGTKGIADYAFSPNPDDVKSLSTISNTEDLVYIGAGAFYMCTSLTSFKIGTKVAEIGDYTFYGCESLEEVGTPVNLEKIGRSAFYACQNLVSLNFSSCIDLSSIGEFAFAYCTSVINVNLPLNANVTEIPEYAFYECNRLQFISIPKTVTSIGESAFFGCSNLTSVTFLQPETAKKGLTTIAKDAFYQCYSLESIDIPDTVTSIGDSAFYGCVAIKSLEIGSGVTYIADNAFCGLSSLTDLEIGRNVKYIGNYAFSSCDSLASVSIPKEVEWIGAYAFYQCDLATVYTDATDRPATWHKRLNASYRPVAWGVTLSEDGYYLVSLTKNKDMLDNENEYNLLTSPSRKGYVFKGFSVTQDSKSAEYSINDLRDLEEGTVLYAVWEEKLPESDSTVDNPEDDTQE